MIKEIKYTGLANQPDNSVCNDGELASMINLVNENGVLKPFVQPDEVMLASGKLLYVHKSNSYENYIRLSNGNLLSSSKGSDTSSVIMENVGDVLKIESIGNTLIVISGNPVRYLLFKEGNYLYLGEKPPMPNIAFKYNNSPSVNWFRSLDNIIYSNSDVIPQDKADQVSNTIWACLNSVTAEYKQNNKTWFPFFIRYALRLYDGSLIHHSAPIFFTILHQTIGDIHTPDTQYLHEGCVVVGSTTTGNQGWHTTFNTSYITLYWNGCDPKWSDIVKSVDIFMSDDIFTYEQSKPISKIIKGKNSDDRYFDIGYHGAGEVNKTIAETSLFYKVYSIPTSGAFEGFGGQDVSTPYTIIDFNAALPKGILANITEQELMEDEYRSHHKISAKATYTYNNRLHLANITSTVFEGFKMRAIAPLIGNNNGMRCFATYVSIKLSSGETVRVECKNNEMDISGHITYIYYPDPRAYLITIQASRLEGTTRMKTSFGLKLQPHQFLNGAYYIGPNLENIFDGGTWWSPYPYPEVIPSLIQSENTSNRLQVSESGNPFVFKALHSYTIGTSEIRAIASATKALSQGQFGQFPLYLLTAEGIWAMEVSPTGTYSSKQMLSRDVCNNGESVLQMDGAVAFTSDRGVMVLQGSEVICISEQLSGTTFRTDKLTNFDKYMTATNNNVFESILRNILDFNTFLSSCDMAYDYPNSRIFVINSSQIYSYVYNLTTGSWSIVLASPSRMPNEHTKYAKYISVTNNFPDSYIHDDHNRIFNLSSVMSNHPYAITSSGLAISRPIKLDDPDGLKTISKVIHRGTFDPSANSTILFGSLDGENYYPIASSTDNTISHIHGSPYKYFRVVIIANMAPKDGISGTTVQYEHKYRNKLR